MAHAPGASKEVIDGSGDDWIQSDDGGYSPNAYSAGSESSREIALDEAPRVTADSNTSEREEQMRALARWKINKRHAQCANCQGSRATGGDGRCRWCGSHVCSEDCFRKHDVKCGERPPVDGGRNPEEVVEALDPSHWRETQSTPMFRAFEALEVVARTSWSVACRIVPDHGGRGSRAADAATPRVAAAMAAWGAWRVGLDRLVSLGRCTPAMAGNQPLAGNHRVTSLLRDSS